MNEAYAPEGISFVNAGTDWTVNSNVGSPLSFQTSVPVTYKTLSLILRMLIKNMIFSGLAMELS